MPSETEKKLVKDMEEILLSEAENRKRIEKHYLATGDKNWYETQIKASDDNIAAAKRFIEVYSKD